jgi:RNA polymerase sigma factor (TIGR02999 family)
MLGALAVRAARNTAPDDSENTLGDDAPLTDWLHAAGSGDSEARQRVYALIYAELRRIAARQMTDAGGRATLTPTVLVHEVFLKFARGALLAVSDRQHFFNLAARAMRQTVIDYARERLAQKRGGDLVRTELDEDHVDAALDAQQALALEQALTLLDRQDPKLAETLNWRVFAGLSTQKIAELRGSNERAVQRELVIARNYLRMTLAGQA